MNFRKNCQPLNILRSYTWVVSIRTVLDDLPFAPWRWFWHNFPREIHKKHAVVLTWNRMTICESSQNPSLELLFRTHRSFFSQHKLGVYTQHTKWYIPLNRKCMDRGCRRETRRPPIGTQCVKTGRPTGWALWLNRSARPLVVQLHTVHAHKIKYNNYIYVHTFTKSACVCLVDTERDSPAAELSFSGDREIRT